MKFQLRHILFATTLLAVLLALVAGEPIELAAAFFAILLAWIGVAHSIAILVAQSFRSIQSAWEQMTWQPLTQLLRLIHLVAIVALLLVVIIALINHVSFESVANAKRAAAWSWIVCPLEWIRLSLRKRKLVAQAQSEAVE